MEPADPYAPTPGPLWKKLRTRIHRWHRDRVLRHAVGELVALGDQAPTEAHYRRLAYGFANEGWAATLDLLDELATRVRKAKVGVLECGPGLTTLLLASLTRRRRLPILSLENDPSWRNKMRRLLECYDLSHAEAALCPLTTYGEFDWYSIPDHLAPDRKFDLVLCDGPPGTTRGGRHGLLPCMRERFTDDCVIIIDDTHRAEDDAVVTKWLETLPGARRSRRDRFTILELGAAKP